MDSGTATWQRAADKLRDLIRNIKFAMLTTCGPDGTLRSRPMATQQTDFHGDLWFFTHLESEKVHDVQRERHVNVAYADPDSGRFVSVCGVATLVRDRRQAQDLWSPVYKAWFPQGLDDPDLALLQVHVNQAEYWDTSSSKMVPLLGFVKAAATGQRYVPPTDHGTLDLSGSEGAGL